MDKDGFLLDFFFFFTCLIVLRGHPFSAYAKFSEKVTFLTFHDAYQGVRNVSFSENFTYLLNEWTLWNTAISLPFYGLIFALIQEWWYCFPCIFGVWLMALILHNYLLCRPHNHALCLLVALQNNQCYCHCCLTRSYKLA